MNVVDWVLIGALALFAVVGWHRGFLSGVMSFLGFLGGGLIAALVLPRILEATSLPAVVRAAVVGIGILVGCFIGQFVAGYFGDHLRDAISWTPARTFDRVGGVALNVLVLAVLTWMVVTIASYLPVTAVSEQMTSSRVARVLDSLVPNQAQSVFDGIQGLLSTTSVPLLFSGLANLSGPEVDPPETGPPTAAVERASRSVVEITGYATECTSDVSGSGFVIQPGRVITNAHVVAGVTQPYARTSDGVTELPAKVVYFDPKADIAVLDVPGLTEAPLELAPQSATTGDPAVVAGFPNSGPFTLSPVRVRTKVTVRTDDIYGDPGTARSVYVVRGGVKKGDSGGPMLRPDGRVLGMAFGSDPEQTQNGYVLANDDLYPAVARSVSQMAAVDTGSCRIGE